MQGLNKLILFALVLAMVFAGGCSPKQPVSTPAWTPTVSAPQASPTAPQAAATPDVQAGPAGQAPVSDVLARLNGLDIDTFYEEAFKQWLLRDPEAVTQFGLADTYGVKNDQLTDISDEYIRQTQALEAGILELLGKYDRAALSPQQRLTADIYTWWLQDRVQGHAFMYDDYPVSQFIYSVPITLLQFFTDIHPVTNLQDAQDYVTRLSQVDTKFAQLIDGLKRREALGVILPAFLIPWTLEDLQSIANSTPKATPYYTAFADKVNALQGVSEADKQALLESAAKEIETSVIPAYKSLVDYMSNLKTAATNDAGVWKFTDGKAYYDYLLHHHTCTDLTADEIHELGQKELERIHTEMRAIFDQLGYPKDADLSTLYRRVAQESGSVSGDKIVSTYKALIDDANQKIQPVFDLRPKADVVVIGVPIGGYYMPPAFDGSRPGAFYASATGSEAKFGMPTLAYHEAVPGHHYQMAVAQELSLPSLRRGMDFTCYVEGWALYAERLVSEVGFYKDDPYGDLGRLQAEAFRAARLVIDTGIHAKHWTYNQAVDYMVKNTGKSRGSAEYEVSRYIVAPGQATAYDIGFLKILELRQKAKGALGDKFDLKEFHNVILGSGAMPLDVLEKTVDEYIKTKQ